MQALEDETDRQGREAAQARGGTVQKLHFFIFGFVTGVLSALVVIMVATPASAT